MTLLGATDTPQNQQRPVIRAGNSKTLLDFSGSTECLARVIPTNKDGIQNQLDDVHTYLCHDRVTLLGGMSTL